MQKDVIQVPRDKCPLDVLAEMGEQMKDAWIFLHKNAATKLIASSDSCVINNCTHIYNLHWEATDAFPETRLSFFRDITTEWVQVLSISAEDIAFKNRPSDPKDIFFLKMADN